MTKVDTTMKVIDETLRMLQDDSMDHDEQFATGVLNLLSDMAVSLSVIADSVSRKEFDNE